MASADRQRDVPPVPDEASSDGHGEEPSADDLGQAEPSADDLEQAEPSADDLE
jgi:hypothetical protein